MCAWAFALLALGVRNPAPAEAQTRRISPQIIDGFSCVDQRVESAVTQLFYEPGVRSVSPTWCTQSHFTVRSIRIRGPVPLDEALRQLLEKANSDNRASTPQERLTFRVLFGDYGIMTEHQARLWDLRRAEEADLLDPNRPHIVVQAGHPSPLVNIAYSPDGELMATGCEEQLVNLWEVKTGKSVRTLPGRLGPRPFGNNGRVLITAVGENVNRWDLDDPRNRVWVRGAHKGGGTWTGEAMNTTRGAIRYSVRRGGVQTATLSPLQNRRIFTSGWDRSVKVWRTFDAALLGQLNTPGLVLDISISPQEGLLAGVVVYADPDPDRKEPVERQVHLWRLEDRGPDLVRFLPLPPVLLERAPIATYWSPDNRRLFVVDDQMVVHVLDAHTREPVTTLSVGARQGGRRCALAFSPDGRLMALSGDRGRMGVYDAASLELLWSTEKPVHDQATPWTVSALAFSPSPAESLGEAGGRQVARVLSPRELSGELAVGVGSLLGHSDKVRTWDLARRLPVRRFSGDAQHVNQVLTMADGTILAGGTAGIRLWRPPFNEPPRFLAAATPMALVPGKPWLVARAGFDSLRVWDLNTLQPVSTIKSAGVPWSTETLAVSPDGETIAACLEGNHIDVFDTETGTRLHRLSGHTEVPRSLRFSPDGRQIASIGDRLDQTLRLWDVQAEREIQRWVNDPALAKDAGPRPPAPELPPGAQKPPPPPPITDAALAWATGRPLLVVRLGDRLRLVRSTDFQELGAYAPGAERPVFHPSQNLIAVRQGADIEILRVSDGRRQGTKIPLVGPLLKFSPSGDQFVAWDAANNYAYLCDTRVGSPRRLSGHVGRVDTADFTRDGSRVVTVSQDGTVRLWNARAGPTFGEEIAALMGMDTRDYLVFTPRNHYMASRGAVRSSVAIRIGGSGFPFEQADLQLNRPDLVLERLGAPPAVVQRAHADVRWRWQRCGYLERAATDGFRPPVVALPTPEASSAERLLRLDVTAADPAYSLQTLHVLVNDVPLFGREGRDLRRKPGEKRDPRVALEEEVLPDVRQWAGPVEIPLSDGENDIQVYVRSTGGLESSRVLRRVTYVGVPHRPSLHVIAVGVSEYRDPTLRLQWAAKDAQDLVRFLETLGTERAVHYPPRTPVLPPEPEPAPAAPPVVAPAPTPPVGKPPVQPARKPTVQKPPARKPPARPAPKPAPRPTRPTRPGAGVSPLAQPKRPPASTLNLVGKAGTFQQVHVQLLLNQDATRENILAARERLLATHPDDTVVVFLAGHGVVAEGDRYYFVTADASLADIVNRGIPYDQLETLVDAIPSRRKMLLLDSCHSGEREDLPEEVPLENPFAEPAGAAERPFQVAEARALGSPSFRGLRGTKAVNLDAPPSGPPPPPNRGAGRRLRDTFSDLRRQSGAFVISAAGYAEYAFEGLNGLRNGSFTFALLEGLSTGRADADGDGTIRVSELRRFVEHAVAVRSGNRQVPTTRAENEALDFPVYQHR